VRTPPPRSGADDRRPLADLAGFSPVDSTNGVTLAVHLLAGTPQDRPLLLAHATGFHALAWLPLARQLNGFQVVAPDLRGHGDSTQPIDRGLEWDGFADDILAVVDAMAAAGIATTGLLAAGHSKGGAALLLAEQRRPGTFGALYCYEPVVMPSDDALGTPSDSVGGNLLAEGALRRRDQFASRAEAIANYSGKLPFSALDPEALDAYVDHGFADQDDETVRLKCRPELEAAVYRMGGTHRAFDHLGDVRCPVTIAMGMTSAFGPAAFAARIADALPRGRLETFPDLGHFGPLEDPHRIATHIMASFN